MTKTSIAWTEETWNPVVGCSHVSAGCAHCYAERLALRYGWSKTPWTAQNAAENVQLKHDRLGQPFSWKRPRMVFVNSMSDLFHERVPDVYLDLVFDVIRQTPQHTYQILTKRPERAAEYRRWYAPNVWIGTSIEDRRSLARIDRLCGCIAPVRFVSFEPLLEDLGEFSLGFIDWAIVGGESGPGYRPMDHAWARRIRDIAARDGAAFFFKQSAGPRPGMGAELVEEDGTRREWKAWPVAKEVVYP